jgi:hypothetical protein
MSRMANRVIQCGAQSSCYRRNGGSSYEKMSETNSLPERPLLSRCSDRRCAATGTPKTGQTPLSTSHAERYGPHPDPRLRATEPRSKLGCISLSCRGFVNAGSGSKTESIGMAASVAQSGHSAESCAASIHRLLVSPLRGRQPEFPLEHPAECFASFSWKSAIWSSSSATSIAATTNMRPCSSCFRAASSPVRMTPTSSARRVLR